MIKNKSEPIIEDMQALAEKFINMNDYSAYACLWQLTSDNVKKYIQNYLNSVNCQRRKNVFDDIYDKTMGDIFDNAKDYYDSTKSRFSTWISGVARRNCISVLSPYMRNNFYIVEADINDIENNNLDEDEYGNYRFNAIEEEKTYSYSINGSDRMSSYDEMMEDIITCVKSCIYYIEDNSKTNRPNREILKKLYIENKQMKETAEELSIKEHTVRNAVTYCRKNILNIFKNKYCDLYHIIEEEHIFDINK